MTKIKDQATRMRDLLDAFDGIELENGDLSLLAWLAGWPPATTDKLADLIGRVRRGAYPVVEADEAKDGEQ